MRVASGRRKRAVTLVEVMIASVISIVLLTVLWRLFSGSVRQFAATQRHLQAMQVAQLVLEYVENDLQAMIVEDSKTPTVLDDLSFRSSISFYASRGDQAEGGIYKGAKVSYGLKPIEGTPYFYFVRNGRTLYNMPLKRLSFQPIEKEALDSLPGKPKSIFFMRTVVVAMDSTREGEFTLIGLTALDLVSRRKLGRHWNPSKLPCIRLERN